MSGTALHRRHGPAGLVVALFVVAGLVFSYGMGHGPPPRVCTEQAVSMPVGAGPASMSDGATSNGATPDVAMPDAATPVAVTAASLSQVLQGPAGEALSAPVKHPPSMPLDVCLCMAVLFTLLLLALVTGLRRPLSRLPARVGWSLAPPGAASTLASPPVLQVLRL
ncbi:hypothetical protein [Actinomadura chokoriensis]|uniref:Uncharacterized protein n=1 Tax=Actinomadura chokoriensis TaxID=454156 RepID=A0ABV4R404_9ACTN